MAYRSRVVVHVLERDLERHNASDCFDRPALVIVSLVARKSPPSFPPSSSPRTSKKNPYLVVAAQREAAL